MKASPTVNRARLGESLIAAVVMLFALPLISKAAERCEPAVARVVVVQGKVEVQAAGAAGWMAAALDQRLCVGDTVRVGALAQAALAFANDSVLSVDQLTTLRLDAPAETGRSLLELLFGAVHFFSHRPRALEIDTPIANAGAEGTEFLMRVRPDRTEVLMFEGRVRLRTAAGELVLASGEAGVATPGAAPRTELVARPRDAVAWALYYPPVLAPLADRRPAPGALPENLQTATLRVAANDYAGAIAALDAVPATARDARYHTYRAGVLLNVGRADEAAQAIERALALEPDAAGALAERAVIAVVQNRREQALADARRAVELAPDSAPARIALSYALQANFDLEAARQTLREAAAQTPENALVWARLAELELSFGDLDAAEAAAARAAALAPDLARTQMVLGFAALTRIEIDRARAAFERAIELDSAEPLARLGLGLARIRAGELEAGRRELEIAAALDPNNSLLRSYLGKAYFEEKRGPQDADQFRIAKELDPNDPTPWFYDAIRKQSENRPVEALRDLETSIRLNDNRAPYRSRLLLDEDLAARESSLARIYDDLGFDQVALVEATRSLNQDPANYSAHRFLSDTYARLPRHEIARASELLQAQLLQPINLNPVQPSLAVTDLNAVTGAGPAEAAFNEFTPLFARNDARLTTTAVAGNHDTYGGETVLSMVSDRMSLSVGGLLSDTDGFRDNDDVKNKLADAYLQVAVTPKLNLQAEYRYRDTDQGDLVLNFDPDDFGRQDRRNIDQETWRLGGRLSPTPQSDLILSFIQSDRNGSQQLLSMFPTVDEDIDENGYQFEGQILFRREWFNLTAGGGLYDIDVDQRTVLDFSSQAPICLAPPCDRKSDFSREQQNVYAYGNLKLPDTVNWTIGFSYDWYDQRDLDVDEFNPKLGVEWDVTEAVRLRAAYFETVKRDLIVSQTIEPTAVAGFNQLFDDINGATSHRYGVGLDLRPFDQLYGGVEVSWREISSPAFTNGSAVQTNWDEDLYRAYLYWTLAADWAISAELVWDRFESNNDENDADVPAEVETLSAPLTLRYFSPLGFFGQIGTTFVHQNVNRRAGATNSDNEGDDDFAVVDAAVGYRLPYRRGIVSLEALNLLDQGFKFEDDDYRSNEPRPPLYIPETTILGRVTLIF